MENKKAAKERVVIAKPIPSRPTSSGFKPFPELLIGTVNVSPSKRCSETAVAAVRPKIARSGPSAKRPPVPVFPSQAVLSESGAFKTSQKDKESGCKRSVVYKPQAKLASKATVSLLANMGGFATSNNQMAELLDTRFPNANQSNSNFRTQLIPQSIVHNMENSKIAASQNSEEDPKASSDGYNWRKYGQKQVKGSDYPRSYYKCTQPSCPVKKMVERAFDGKIKEIVYKGEHNHPKPQLLRRNSSGQDHTNYDVAWTNQLHELNEESEGRVENGIKSGFSSQLYSLHHGKCATPYLPIASSRHTNSAAGLSDVSCGLTNKENEENDEPRSKRRKNDDQSSDAGGMSIPESPQMVLQSSTDSEILDDGFRWRKYGQKVVKGNPYPRSYYRCTSLKCNVRKHVERASDDPRAFVTTYEGKHNHEMPLRSLTTNTLIGSEQTSAFI